MKKDEMEKIISEPLIVKSHDVTLDADYAEWIAEVKHRYRSAQVKAAVKVNAEKLLWNWRITGTGISDSTLTKYRQKMLNEVRTE